MESWENFRKDILKVTGNRKHKITHSLGVYDAYKYIRKNKWFNIPRPLTEHEFYSIIRSINNLIAEDLSRGIEVILPQRMGLLEVRKKPTMIKLVDNKVVTNKPIDWDSTLKLWYEDEEAFTNKTLIRQTDEELYKLIYNKSNALYNNKSFYDIKFNRDIKSVLKRNIRNHNIEVFNMY